MLEIRKGCEQGFDREMSAGAELTVRAPQSMVAANCGGTPALQKEKYFYFTSHFSHCRSARALWLNKTSKICVSV